jgi:hypothetical protein
MEKTSRVCFPQPRVTASFLLAAALAMAGCQSEDSKGGNSASPTSEKWSCGKVLSAQVEEAVRRVADIPASVKVNRYGHPKDAADGLIANHDAGTLGKADNLGFCSFYRETVEAIPSVEVKFSLVEDIPEKSDDSIGEYYRLGKAAVATTKKGVLYFECSSKKFSMGDGAAVLVRGESRTNDEVTESEAAAREDNLRIVYESSRALSDLLGCKSNAGLPSSFSMPPEV